MATFERSIPVDDPAGVAVAWQDALVAMGWEQTEDTGQLDPVTEPFPETAGATWGAQFWRPGDGLGGLILRLQWYRGSSTSNPSSYVHFRVGAATDGAGGFVGDSWAHPSATGSGFSDPPILLMGGDSSGFYAAMGFNYDGSGSSRNLRGAIIVDRSRDANGEPTTDGAAFLHNLGEPLRTTIRVGKPGAGSWTGGENNRTNGLPLYPLCAVSGSGLIGGSFSPDSSSTPVFPSVLAGQGTPTWVSPLFVGVHPNDMPPGLTADIAGRSRYYRKVRTAPTTASNISAGLATLVINTGTETAWPMMLWED